MSNGKFVSLHNHTELGSPLDGMNRVDEIFARAKEVDHPAIAITDHGTLTAHYDCWNESKKTGVKFIPGCEFYFADDLDSKKNNHMVLLSSNEIGYRNILRLNYEAYKNQSIGYMGKATPRISWDHISKYNEGVICLTACSNGLIAKTLITDGDEERALCYIDRLNTIFKDRFYLEIQPHSLYAVNKNGGEVNQTKLNQSMIRISHDKNIPYVITCDAHYKDKDHAKYHDFMLAIKDKKPVDDPDRFRYGVQDMYLKNHYEIEDFFGKEIAEVGMKNSMDITARCEIAKYLEPKGPILPKFPVKSEKNYEEFSEWKDRICPDLEDDKAYFRYKCIEGFKKKFGTKTKEEKDVAWNRVKTELSVIEERDFSSYMLIVADYINWAKDNGMPVGVGRGCLTYDTPVIMKNGVKKLGDIKIGDYVYSHTGQTHKVLNTMKYEINEDILSIKTYFGDNLDLRLTSDHKVFGQKAKRPKNWDNWSETTKDSRASWVSPTSEVSEIQAKDLSVGDWIFYPSLKRDTYIPSWSFEKASVKILKNSSFKFSIRNIAKETGLSRHFIKDVSRRSNSVNLNGRAYNKLSSHLNTHNLTVEDWINKWSEDKYREYSISNTITLDKDLAWLIGKWVADGWLVKNKKAWGVAFHEDEIEQQEKVIAILKNIAPNSYVSIQKHKTKKLIQISTSNSLLIDWWSNLFSTYKHTSQTKMLPSFYASLPDNLLESLLDGIIDGDGYQEGYRASICSTSRSLVEQIKHIALCLGMPANIRMEERVHKHLGHTHKSTAYYVVIPNKDNKKRYRYHSIDGGFFCQIKEISIISNEKYVYDITVDCDHSYLTTNGAVHNSASGALVAYLTGITAVDPLKYDLIFERFHNREKKSYPDIDTDFADPSKVKDYLKQKYGEDNVASISNWSTLSPKVIVKDVARSLNIGGSKSTAFEISNHITSIMPDSKTIEEAMEESEEFSSFMRKYPELYENASKLQGLTRNWSVHAAGVVIADRPLYEIVPLRIEEKTGIVITQWEKNRCEANGLIKMDLLGLKTLSVMDECLSLINQINGEKIDIEQIPIDDSATFKMISDGNTAGVFQLESTLTPLCKRIRPKSISDISDINALGRPSCSAETREIYINRRLKKEKVKVLHKNLERSLLPTEGILLYEESAMYIAKDCAGWNLNEADALRKISKLKGKDPDLVMKTEMNFIQDCMKHSNVSYKEATDIWRDTIEGLSGYAFNKSHSISYSYISYYTAWLKKHYPTQFMCSLLNSEDPNSDKAQEYLAECKSLNIKIIPPDLSASNLLYTVLEDGTIVTGLSAIKGVGETAINNILQNRPYKSMIEFFVKTEGRVVNKRVIESLAKAGAFDRFNVSRKYIHDEHAKIRTKITSKIKKIKDSMDTQFEVDDSIFIDAISKEMSIPNDTLEWDRKELLLFEKEVLGRTISGSLHEIFGEFFKKGSVMVTPLSKINECTLKSKIKIEVIVNNKIKEFTIKNGPKIGKKFAKYAIEDAYGNTSEMTVWTEDYMKYKDILTDGAPIKAICQVNEYMGQKGLSLAVLERRI